MIPEYIVQLLAQFLAVMVVLTLHEFAHAFAAYKCGDPTAKFSGRMTLNPTKHFDPLGVLMFAVAGFGWAKPVPINPNNFDNYRKGSLWTSSAGVLVNYLTAFLFYPLFLVMFLYVIPLVRGTYMELFINYLFYCLYAYSLSFCVFNLLPLYPLDGFRIVEATDRRNGKVYQFLRDYSHYILMGLILLHVFSSRISYLAYIDVLGYILNFAIQFFGKPILLLWHWIFNLT